MHTQETGSSGACIQLIEFPALPENHSAPPPPISQRLVMMSSLVTWHLSLWIINMEGQTAESCCGLHSEFPPNCCLYLKKKNFNWNNFFTLSDINDSTIICVILVFQLWKMTKLEQFKKLEITDFCVQDSKKKCMGADGRNLELSVTYRLVVQILCITELW